MIFPMHYSSRHDIGNRYCVIARLPLLYAKIFTLYATGLRVCGMDL